MLMPQSIEVRLGTLVPVETGTRSIEVCLEIPMPRLSLASMDQGSSSSAREPGTRVQHLAFVDLSLA